MRLKELHEIVAMQQHKIDQTTKALNLCHSTYFGSSEHVGGKWALFVASKFLLKPPRLHVGECTYGISTDVWDLQFNTGSERCW